MFYQKNAIASRSRNLMIAAGTQLGRYEILSQLGAGGMREVYWASNTRLDRIVAKKAGYKDNFGTPVKGDEA